MNKDYSFNLAKTTRKYAYYVYKNQKLNYRDKKRMLRLIFNAWHQTPDEYEEHNEKYWKLKFDDGELVRSFLFREFKGLSITQQIKFLSEVFKREKSTLNKNEKGNN